MIPISDVIPTRTTPLLTLTLIALSALFVWLLDLGSHASLIANMVSLWLFGWTVEDRLGRPRFAVLFVSCAATAWMLSTPHSAVAGGAAGVLGGYFVLYPRSLVLVLVPLPSLVSEVPAVTFLGVWFVSQILLGPFPFLPQLAGFVAGAALCLLMKRPERLRVDWWCPSQVSGIRDQVSGSIR
jgi:membrane associated rhomboid family serine protease